MFLLFQTAFADCAAGSLSVMPAIGDAIPERPELVVHAYGTERAKLADLGPDDLSLRTSKGSMPLEVVAHHRGSFSDDQLVLRPKGPLPPGQVTLVLRGETPKLWTGGGHQEVSWQVSQIRPQQAAWKAAPVLKGTELHPMGCGPSTHANVQVPVNTPWVEVELTVTSAGSTGPRERVGEPVRGRLSVEQGSIAIGHGMCSGLFQLVPGTSYTAQLTAVAADGTRSPAPATVTFVAPGA